jgi:hypothetical protein
VIKIRTFEVQVWLSQIQPVASQAPFRNCFRLDPPTEDDKSDSKWWLHFYLQAYDDRSLLVPAEKVWKERSGTLTVLKRKFENPQERLLTDLGKASRLFPTLEESLKIARPVGLELSASQAYTFLRKAAPILEQSGFGVLLPPWWQKTKTRLGVKLKIGPKAGTNVCLGLVGLDGIVTYDWRIAVGDEALSLEEFEKLVRLKIPLVKIRSQ